MFVLKKSETFKWPVKIETPADGGTFKRETFTAEFRRVTKEELKDFFKEENGNPVLDDDAICKKIVASLSDIKDEKGQDIEYESSVLDTLLSTPGISSSILKAFNESLSGSKLKN